MKKQHFDTPVIIIGGGYVNEALLSALLAKGFPVIAADGAADFLGERGILPVAIVGDMDSITDLNHWRDKAQIIHLTEQDTTDFEKCLYSFDAPLYYGLGLLGGRLDHAQAALHVLAKYADSKTIVLLDEYDLAFATTKPLTMELSAGERVSILPLEPITFKSSSGLKYPLDGLTMKLAKQIGTSNEANKQIVHIETKADNTAAYAVILAVENYRRLTKPFNTGG